MRLIRLASETIMKMTLNDIMSLVMNATTEE